MCFAHVIRVRMSVSNIGKYYIEVGVISLSFGILIARLSHPTDMHMKHDNPFGHIHIFIRCHLYLQISYELE